MKILSYFAKVSLGLSWVVVKIGVIILSLWGILTGIGKTVLWVTAKLGGPATMWAMDGLFGAPSAPSPIHASICFLFTAGVLVLTVVWVVLVGAKKGDELIASFKKRRAA